MAKSNIKQAAAPTNVASPKALTKGKWANVFAAHPEADEIFIGKNGDGIEQPFLERGHALNFAKGVAENMQRISRNTAPEAPAAKGDATDENTGNEGGEAADNADETGEEGAE